MNTDLRDCMIYAYSIIFISYTWYMSRAKIVLINI